MTTVTEPDFHYSWLTRLSPHSLLQECTPYNQLGGFRAPVEVVVFPSDKRASGFKVLTSRDYLREGDKVDRGTAAVRFNADAIDQFSVIWEPVSALADPQAVGRVHVVAPPRLTSIMHEMIEKSATPQERKRIDAVLNEANELNGSEVPPMLRPSATEAGLVKSVSVPPGALRLVSRLDRELLQASASISHELVIAATLPDGMNVPANVRCEVAVFPRGWVTLAVPGRSTTSDVVVVDVTGIWVRPQDGRRGGGSRYLYESVVSHLSVILASSPPASRRPASGRQGAEIRARLLRRGTELCRLHHAFSIEPPKVMSPSKAVPGPFADQLQHLLDLALLTSSDIAGATGVPVEIVQAWLKDERDPTGEQAGRVNELSAIVDRLATAMTPDFIAIWLRKPLRVLGDEKPLDLLARGDYRVVSRIVAGLESPVAS